MYTAILKIINNRHFIYSTSNYSGLEILGVKTAECGSTLQHLHIQDYLQSESDKFEWHTIFKPLVDTTRSSCILKLKSGRYLWAEVVSATQETVGLLSCQLHTEVVSSDKLKVLVDTDASASHRSGSNITSSCAANLTTANVAEHTRRAACSTSMENMSDTASQSDNSSVAEEASVHGEREHKVHTLNASESMSFEDVFTDFTSDEDFSTPEPEQFYRSSSRSRGPRVSKSSSTSSSSSSRQNRQLPRVREPLAPAVIIASEGSTTCPTVSATPASQDQQGDWGWFLSTSLK